LTKEGNARYIVSKRIYSVEKKNKKKRDNSTKIGNLLSPITLIPKFKYGRCAKEAISYIRKGVWRSITIQKTLQHNSGQMGNSLFQTFGTRNSQWTLGDSALKNYWCIFRKDLHQRNWKITEKYGTKRAQFDDLIFGPKFVTRGRPAKGPFYSIWLVTIWNRAQI